MAIVTHRTSKNAKYADVLTYYSFRHKESQQTKHYEPILDEYGLMIARENYSVAYINAQGEEADPEQWATACVKTNILFRKNRDADDRKSHEYILSHPEEDREYMTMDDLLAEGKAFAKEYLNGYDCLIAVHRDTDNDHIHISINSVRAMRREEQEWMTEKNGRIIAAEVEAGGKHQDSPGLRRHMNDWLLNYTREHGLAAKDNNTIADARRAQRYGSKNDQMRAALLECAGKSRNMKELQTRIKADYGMELKISETGKTIRILYPGNKKYVRLRTLKLEPADISRCFAGERYAFTCEEEARQIQRELETEEKKKYAEWLRVVRVRNNERAEETVRRAEELLKQRLRRRGEKYLKEEFQDIRYLIRQTSYVASNLQTELEKVDRLLRRWELYEDLSLPEKERQQHGGYIRWCGCDPECAEELEDLKAEREIIVAQQAHAAAMHEALLHEADRWRGRNNLTYAENNLAWTKQREKQLKQQLQDIKESCEKLWTISCYCERAAEDYQREHLLSQNRKVWREMEDKWDKVYRVRVKYRAAMKREKEIQRKLEEIKQKKKDAKEQVRDAKRKARNRN